MDPFAPRTIVVAWTAASLLAWRARRRGSLTPAGTLVGWLVGFALVATGLRGLLLFVFYQLGSSATRYKAAVKAQFDATGQSLPEESSTTASPSSSTTTNHHGRTAAQVLCVSIVAVVLSLLHAYYFGPEQAIAFFGNDPYDGILSSSTTSSSHVACAVVAHHAASLGDTWASELGMLSTVSYRRPDHHYHTPTHSCHATLATRPRGDQRRDHPRRHGVECGRGYHAGSGHGTGRCIVGHSTPPHPVLDCVRGHVWGVGSLLDSCLGATLQATYYDVDTKRVVPCPAAPKQQPHDKKQTKTSSPIQHICGRPVLTNEQVNLVSVTLTALVGGWGLAPWIFRVVVPEVAEGENV